MGKDKKETKVRVKRMPTFAEAALPIVAMLIILTVGKGVYGFSTEPLLILVACVAAFVAWRVGVTWDEMLEEISNKIAKDFLPAFKIEMQKNNVNLKGCEKTKAIIPVDVAGILAGYNKIFEISVKGKVSAKKVKEYFINYITNPPKKDENSEASRIFRMIVGEELLERKKGEVVIEDIENPNAPMYRNGVGYKTELENGAFKLKDENLYNDIQKRVDARFNSRQPIVDKLTSLVKDCMKDLTIEGKVYGRKKHIYSIYKKMDKGQPCHHTCGVAYSNGGNIGFCAQLILFCCRKCYSWPYKFYQRHTCCFSRYAGQRA